MVSPTAGGDLLSPVAPRAGGELDQPAGLIVQHDELRRSERPGASAPVAGDRLGLRAAVLVAGERVDHPRVLGAGVEHVPVAAGGLANDEIVPAAVGVAVAPDHGGFIVVPPSMDQSGWQSEVTATGTRPGPGDRPPGA